MILALRLNGVKRWQVDIAAGIGFIFGMNRNELIVTWMVRLEAGLMMLAIPCIFLPFSTMDQIHGWLGMGSLPREPIVEYLARSCAALYGMHGVIMMLIGIAPRRHWSLIGPIALLHIGLGAVVLVTDIQVGMPWFWTLAEGGPVMAYGAAMFYFWRRADRHPPPPRRPVPE